MFLSPKEIFSISPNQEKKVINDTAKITPGKAYPEILIKLKYSKNLLFEILLPKFIKNEKNIKKILARNTSISVFIFKEIISISCKYLGNFIVQ